MCVIARIGDIEIALAFDDIIFEKFFELIKMVGHADSVAAVHGVDVDIDGFDEAMKKPQSIVIVFEDILAFIPSACDMVHCAAILDTRGTDHIQP